MIDAAEAAGELRPGGRPRSRRRCRAGAGGQRRGYRCVFVCPDKVSSGGKQEMRAVGARARSSSARPLSTRRQPRSYYSASDAGDRDRGRWKPNQYSNPSRVRTTRRPGPSCGADRTSRTSSPVSARAAPSAAPGDTSRTSGGRVRIVGADPVGSVYSGGTGRPYLVEGVGEDFCRRRYDREVCDEIAAGPTATPSCRLAREEGRSSAAPAGWRSRPRWRSPDGPARTSSCFCHGGRRRRCSTTSGGRLRLPHDLRRADGR